MANYDKARRCCLCRFPSFLTNRYSHCQSDPWFYRHSSYLNAQSKRIKILTIHSTNGFESHYLAFSASAVARLPHDDRVNAYTFFLITFFSQKSTFQPLLGPGNVAIVRANDGTIIQSLFPPSISSFLDVYNSRGPQSDSLLTIWGEGLLDPRPRPSCALVYKPCWRIYYYSFSGALKHTLCHILTGGNRFVRVRSLRTI